MLSYSDEQINCVKEFAKSNPSSKIACIKLIREKYGFGLKEAKELVDHVFRELSENDPSFAEASAQRGCAASILMFSMIPLAAYSTTLLDFI